MNNDEKLKIALEALIDIQALTERRPTDYAYDVQRVVRQALRDIQRDHYLGDPSPAVAEALGARRV